MKVAVCTLGALVSVLPVMAQRQTGASGGIPVPAAPIGSADIPSSQDAGQARFRIRVVDGRNGAPLQAAHVAVWYDEIAGSGTLLTTDTHGVAFMPAPLGEPVRVLVRFEDLVDCRKHTVDSVPNGFNLQATAARGQTAENTCGSIAEHQHQGELVLFARPLRWYEGLNRGTTN